MLKLTNYRNEDVFHPTIDVVVPHSELGEAVDHNRLAERKFNFQPGTTIAAMASITKLCNNVVEKKVKNSTEFKAIASWIRKQKSFKGNDVYIEVSDEPQMYLRVRFPEAMADEAKAFAATFA